MKGTLTFDLPEERTGFNIYSKGMDWALAAWDLDLWLRNKIKSSNKGEPEYQAVREELYKILEDRGLSFEDI